MTTLMGGAFVGRQREMGKLKTALEDALSDQGQLLMLVGEPGIGKTRTAQELAAYAEARGAQVLWGWCYEEEGAPPFWPWVQPIRSYIQQRDAEQLRPEMGPGAADIAEVVSEVRGKLPGLEPPAALQPEQARFHLFGSIATLLKKAAQSQPLMLVLDDLHWADKSSLLLLQFLARRLGESHLLVVGCYRDLELSRQQPLSEALAQLSRLPVFQRELLLGMSQEDTGQFIEANTGIIPHPRLVEAIYAHTEGNPFFMKEILRVFSERGELEAVEVVGPRDISMPEGVREAIGQRLNRLSEHCNGTLAIASIVGREFDFHLLHALSEGTTEEQLLRVIDEALAAHLIEESPGGRERYRFSHVLIQETLAEGLSVSRKVRWHARIGKVLEELYGADVEAHAAELAYHFAEAITISGPEKMVRYSLLAGEQALATYAYEEAEAHFRQGLAAKEGRPVDAETADLLFGLGRAQAVMRSSIYSNENLYRLQGKWQVARDFSNRGLAMSPNDPRLLGSRALLEYQVGEFVQGEAYLRRLLEVVPLTPAGPNVAHAIQTIVIPLIAHITGVGERLEAAETAAQTILSASSATPFIAKLARTGLALLALLRRDLSATRELYDTLEPHRGTMSSFIISDGRLLGLLSTVQGRLDQAIAHFEDALAFCRQAGCRPELAWTCYDYADVLLQHHNAGNREDAMALLDEALAIACELGMGPLAERAATLQEQSQLQSLTAAYPDGLSQREVEVLCRVAAGKSNREIAEELVIADGTVRRHVSNIYNKIGAINRSEATRYALRAGLLDLD
jgi:DNA-binding CsgD family transcriptional regulator